MVALLAPAADVPAGSVRLDCESRMQDDPTGRLSVPDRGPSPLRITLELQQRRISSVLVEGPPLFSSYRLARTPQGVPRQLLLPSGLRWRGHFQGRALRFRREAMDMVLEPVRGEADAYSGVWTYVLPAENRSIEVNGTVRCRLVAGSLTESAPS